MKKIILIILLALFNLSIASAAGQVPDKLHLNDKEYDIYTYPLESYPQVDKFRSKTPAKDSSLRNYLASWTIKDQKLYWLNTKEDKEIPAEWFTGKIAISVTKNKAKIFDINLGLIQAEQIVTLDQYNQLKESISLLKIDLKKYEKEMAELQAKLFNLDRKRKKLRLEEKELEKQLASKKVEDADQLKVRVQKLGDAIDGIRIGNDILHSRLVKPREEYDKLIKEFKSLGEKYNTLSNLF